MIVIRCNHTIVWIGCLIAISVASNVSAAVLDHLAPIVLDVNPVPDETGVLPTQTIEAHLYDEDVFPGIPGSGVDLQTIRLSLNGTDIPFYADNLGGNRVFVHSNCPSPMPPYHTMKCELSARDCAGNRMPNYVWYFVTTHLPDTTPPNISSLSPPPYASDVPPRIVISSKIFDYESGIDPDLLTMTVNGNRVDLVIKPVTFGFFVSYEPVMPFEYDSIVIVEITATDYAGNFKSYEWRFEIMSEPMQPPELVSPENDAMLNYQIEDGVMKLQWTFENAFPNYRLFLSVAGTSGFHDIDLEPGDYEVIGGAVATKAFAIDHDTWKHLASLGKVRWFIQMLDQPGGIPVCPDSEKRSFVLANPDTVVLRAPFDRQKIFDTQGSPIFRWDPFDNAIQYTLCLAVMGQDGEVLGDYFVRNIESELLSFRFTQALWDQLPSGVYIWTVAADLPNGDQSEFTNYCFYRYKFPPIQGWIEAPR